MGLCCAKEEPELSGAARAAALSEAREIRVVQIQMRPGCYRMCVQWFVKFS